MIEKKCEYCKFSEQGKFDYPCRVCIVNFAFRDHFEKRRKIEVRK